MRRRHFLTFSATALGGLLVYTLDRQPMRVHAQGERKIRVPLRFFDAAGSARSFRLLRHGSFRAMRPGPGAAEAGVIIYIDRQLGGPYGRDRNRYTRPPFEDGVPEQGYQGKATPREVYREGLALLGPGFDRLTPAEQDDRLRGIETTYFFRLLRQHTIEGMFCDPMHGGQCRPDRVAGDRLSGPIHELERAHRPALRRGVPAQAAQPQRRGGACRSNRGRTPSEDASASGCGDCRRRMGGPADGQGTGRENGLVRGGAGARRAAQDGRLFRGDG